MIYFKVRIEYVFKKKKRKIYFTIRLILMHSLSTDDSYRLSKWQYRLR